MWDSEPSLIDLEAETANRAEDYLSHRERLSEKASYMDEAIVRTCENVWKYVFVQSVSVNCR